MESVFKSLLNKSSEDYLSYIDYFLDVERKVLISSQEEQAFKFLKESFENSGTTPTEEYFLQKFDMMKVPFKAAKELSLTDLKVHVANLVHRRLNQEASKNLMKIATEVAQSGFTYEHLDLIRSYANLTEDTAVVDTTKSSDSFREFYNQKKKQPTGLQTFIKDIDTKIGGMSPGSLTTLAGYTSHGKTTLAANIAYNNAKKLNYNICYLSLEVPKEDMMYNFLSRHSFEPKFTQFAYVPHEKMRFCTMSDEEEKFIMEDVLNDFMTTGGKIHILDETDFKTMSFGEIREKLQAVDDMMLEETGYPLDAVFVDHAQLLKFNSSGKRVSSESAMINEYISFFRKLSIDFRRDAEGNSRKLAILLLSQINRDGWKRAVKNNGQYNLNALAEANELERGSQIIMTIFTDEQLKMANEAKIQLLKNRNGVTMTESASLFADFRAYVIGDDMQGFQDTMSMDDLESVFDSGTSLADIL